ncbi:hypothetical protein LO762_17060 [Actinocorallia sp. API 0066]|uniref:hypothetical protein n=1 Tax=Actinocorallia sp. API 0066 TaxID=2896846 RepID=UPI001E390809|nr:hypothetical protein [Actinocorallia sp. API 0066]MCD0450891.1 hypothetical protein [Actinocorallia sp. API 0066]
MPVIFVGIMPDNPGGACPAVFRAAEPGGGYYFQGKIVERRPVPNGRALVWLPESMTEIIRAACDVHPSAGTHGDGKTAGTGQATRTDDGFHIQGTIVADPEILAKIAADSPILADELVVWLPETATVEIVEACDVRGVV